MTTKALKGVSEDKWAEFKSIAARRGTTMGELFNESVDLIEKHKAKTQWKRIMEYVETHKPALTDEDLKRMKEFRKSFKMREFK